ncbi:unnamed protein product [Cylindrotheca closterium]|uniref:VWFD domain-containing protein n=1 Tax=Cylindrotheca closterium TaxID=2856 RepID=A0AAD2FKJ2_9STRA|nr:unnamed protein product [Cylindrotheca closterium]
MRSFLPLLASLLLGATLSSALDEDSQQQYLRTNSIVEGGYVGPPRLPADFIPSDVDVKVTVLEQETIEARKLQTCTPTVLVQQSCYSTSDVKIIAEVKICSGVPDEWLGIFHPTDTGFASALNFQYTCGGQACGGATGPPDFFQSPTTYLYEFNAQTTGSEGWPLPVDSGYRLWYHSKSGSYGSNSFSVGNCGGPVVAPPTAPPPTAPPPTAPSTPACSHSVSVNQNCWGLGQTITATISTCGNNVEWVGIWDAGTGSFRASYNWQYLCGNQGCNSRISAGTRTYSFSSATAGSVNWPLPAGRTYQLYFHSTFGTIASQTFQVTSGTSCSSSPTAPTAPSSPTAPTAASSAPATTAGGGSTAPASAPIGIQYAPASATDCAAIQSGNIVVGQSAMPSQTFYFVFALGVYGPALDSATVASIVKTAFQNLISTGVVNCSHRRKLMQYRQQQHHKNRRHKNRHHHHHHRQLESRLPDGRRRLELVENVIGNVMFHLICNVHPECQPGMTGCFECTASVEVYKKGPAADTDIEALLTSYLEDPNLLVDSGLEDQDFAFLRAEEITFITTDPTSGPTSLPTSGPTSAPSPVPTSGPTIGPTTSLPGIPDGGTGDGGDDEPKEDPGKAGSNGDPHFKSWAGDHFEFHGQCDLVLAKDAKFADGLGLHVQIRTKLVRYWSYIKSAAIQVGDDILEVQGSADTEDIGSAHFWYNLEYQGKMETVGGFPVSVHIDNGPRRKHIFEIDLSSKYPGQKIMIDHTMKEFVKVDFVGPSIQAFGNTVGMLGDFKTGSKFARDQITVIADFNELGNEWQVLPSDDMLFHDVSAPQFPERCLLPEDPQGQRRHLLEGSISGEQAEAACAQLKDPLSIKDCVYDILATQDLDMVGAY